MYSSQQQQQHSHFIDDTSADTEEDRPAYGKILQWSIDKLSKSGSTGQRRRRQQNDLRRTLLIASVMGKARAGVLHERALQFLETKPQMLPPTGYCVGAAARLPQQQQQQEEQPEQQEQPEPELHLHLASESAFGYCPINEADELEGEQIDDDALSASADAIVMSSVELSIQDLDEPPEQQQHQQQQLSPTSRKRKQSAGRHPKRTRQSLSAEEEEEDEECEERAEAGPPDSGLRHLQASFVDLSMSGWGCRQQASTASAFGFGFGFRPECFSFA